ncbi:MAG: hypothetical protein RMJ67_02220 [Elusimicrobiota bacterium]|nr:hypothetical protein [Endomicrobiia bacterium]MDW8165317.1 hypothetical protein [Elusimicrobiota bacterium]
MKIKKFKVSYRIKEIYRYLKENNINITDEIDTLISIVDKEIAEIILPSAVFETYNIKNEKIHDIINNLSIPKNTQEITFIIVTLGKKITEFLSSITDEIKKLITFALLQEYLNSSVIFICKILQEQNKDLEMGTVFLVPENLYERVCQLLISEKIEVYYSHQKLLPEYTSLNYVLWFRKK